MVQWGEKIRLSAESGLILLSWHIRMEEGKIIIILLPIIMILKSMI